MLPPLAHDIPLGARFLASRVTAVNTAIGSDLAHGRPKVRSCAGFWTPANTALRTLRQPASKKRQGTKSREVGHGLGSKRYGDLMSAPSSMVGGTLARRQSNVCREGKPGECNGHLGERSECINTRSAH
jgi:hypothetical protein